MPAGVGDDRGGTGLSVFANLRSVFPLPPSGWRSRIYERRAVIWGWQSGAWVWSTPIIVVALLQFTLMRLVAYLALGSAAFVGLLGFRIVITPKTTAVYLTWAFIPYRWYFGPTTNLKIRLLEDDDFEQVFTVQVQLWHPPTGPLESVEFGNARNAKGVVNALELAKQRLVGTEP